MTEIQFTKGDATRPEGEGRKIIAHICNDGGGWGAGFVMALSRRDYTPERFYRKWFKDGVNPLGEGEKFGLGQVQFAPFFPGAAPAWINVTVANMIAQHGFEFEETLYGTLPPLRYTALAACLYRVKKQALATGASVHMPRIGCGLAGGKWHHVAIWIERALCRFDIPVTVYDLP